MAGRKRPAHFGRRAAPIGADNPHAPASRPRIRRLSGIAQAGPAPVRNANRAPPPIFRIAAPRSAASAAPPRKPGPRRPCTSPARKPARRACLGHRTIACTATAGGGKAPPIIPSGRCSCTAPPPTRPLQRLVWPKSARLPATAAGDFFPPSAMPALHRETKKTARRRQPLRSALRVRAGRPPSDRQPSRPRQARSRGKKGLTL